MLTSASQGLAQSRCLINTIELINDWFHFNKEVHFLAQGHHVFESHASCHRVAVLKTVRSLVFLQLAARHVSLQWNSPSLILFMFSSLSFWTLSKYTRALNLLMQNTSRSRFVSAAEPVVVPTLPSSRSLAETWNASILESQSRRNPLVMHPLCPSGGHRSIDYPS